MSKPPVSLLIEDIGYGGKDLDDVPEGVLDVVSIIVFLESEKTSVTDLVKGIEEIRDSWVTHLGSLTSADLATGKLVKKGLLIPQTGCADCLDMILLPLAELLGVRVRAERYDDPERWVQSMLFGYDDDVEILADIVNLTYHVSYFNLMQSEGESHYFMRRAFFQWLALRITELSEVTSKLPLTQAKLERIDQFLTQLEIPDYGLVFESCSASGIREFSEVHSLPLPARISVRGLATPAEFNFDEEVARRQS